MGRRRDPRPTTTALVQAATGAYLANCTLGLAVQTRLVDTSAHRWVHHALYIVTASLTGAAIAVGWWRRDARATRLAPVAVPLALLPRVGRRAHPWVGAIAAPCYAAAAFAGVAPRRVRAAAALAAAAPRTPSRGRR